MKNNYKYILVLLGLIFACDGISISDIDPNVKGIYFSVGNNTNTEFLNVRF